MHVKLTDQQRGLAMAIAMRRNNPKVAAGVPSQRLTDARGELDTHLVGVESEIAVAWLYGADMDAHAGLGGDEGYDLEIAGRKVEVKCRKKQGYTFALMDTGPLRAEAGVLVYECDGGYLIHGVISRQKFMKVAERVDYGYGERLAAGPEHFSHWSSLVYTPGQWMGVPQQATTSLIRQGWALKAAREATICNEGCYTFTRHGADASGCVECAVDYIGA